MKIYKILSVLFIIIGITLNEFTIKFISNYETKFDTIEKSLIIIFIQILLISIGIYFKVKKGKAVQNIIILIITYLILIIILETLLSISFFQNLDSDKPIWIPSRYKQINININKSHHQTSLNNKYGFNDNNHSYYNNNKELRIAVLGDSFIWGIGVSNKVIWTRKLEKLFKKNDMDCEILNWGKSGWATYNQYNFLKDEGFKYQFDYLIFAFVVNDPIMDSSVHKQIIYPEGFVDRNILRPLSFFFPNSISFFMDIINNFFSTYFDYGYFNWLANKVYTDTNLNNYSDLLKEIKKYCQERNIAYSFIMTPENHNPILQEYFNRIIKLFYENNIPYYNLFPNIKNVLNKYSVRELWANPADGHPGNLVTDVYAKYIYDYLRNEFQKSQDSLKIKNQRTRSAIEN